MSGMGDDKVYVSSYGRWESPAGDGELRMWRVTHHGKFVGFIGLPAESKDDPLVLAYRGWEMPG